MLVLHAVGRLCSQFSKWRHIPSACCLLDQSRNGLEQQLHKARFLQLLWLIEIEMELGQRLSGLLHAGTGVGMLGQVGLLAETGQAGRILVELRDGEQIVDVVAGAGMIVVVVVVVAGMIVVEIVEVASWEVVVVELV